MKAILSLTILCCVLSFTSCMKKDSSVAGNMNGQYAMSVYLTDDPTVYDRVNLDIQEVQIKKDNDQSEDGWQTLHMSRAGVYNLLRFTNGADTILATDKIANAQVSQIRLILGTNNTVVVDGVSYPLETPSAQESGIKINIDANLVAGIEYKVWLDFDASRSIVVTGDGKYLLKPVIRAFTQAVSGSVKGIVLPLTARPDVYAIINANDTIASAKPDSLTGMFVIPGLSAGTYKIAVDGRNGFSDTTYNNVSVTNEEVTDIGTVELHL